MSSAVLTFFSSPCLLPTRAVPSSSSPCQKAARRCSHRVRPLPCRAAGTAYFGISSLRGRTQAGVRCQEQEQQQKQQQHSLKEGRRRAVKQAHNVQPTTHQHCKLKAWVLSVQQQDQATAASVAHTTSRCRQVWLLMHLSAGSFLYTGRAC